MLNFVAYVTCGSGTLGRGYRCVVPRCVVLSIRHAFPNPDGKYAGFKSKSDPIYL